MDQNHFLWNPFAEHSVYRVHATWNEIPLTQEQIGERYGFSRIYFRESDQTRWETNSMDKVFGIIRRIEATRKDKVQVSIQYMLNGRDPQTWSP